MRKFLNKHFSGSPLRKTKLLCHILWWIFIIFSIYISCRKNSTGTSSKQNEVNNNLSFIREDGSLIFMGTNYAICCGIWEVGYIDKNVLKIFYYDAEGNEAGWKLFLLLEKTSQDTTYTFPSAEPGQGAINMFILDTSTGNELNSTISGSSGTITIHSFKCSPPVTIDLSIDAVIGSEYHNEPAVIVSGTFNCTIYSNPAPFGCEFSF